MKKLSSKVPPVPIYIDEGVFSLNKKKNYREFEAGDIVPHNVELHLFKSHHSALIYARGYERGAGVTLGSAEIKRIPKPFHGHHHALLLTDPSVTPEMGIPTILHGM